MMKKLTVDQSFCLQWLAAAYPRPFRDVAKSAAWLSLIRKGLARKTPTDAERYLRRLGERYPYAALNLVDYHLTANGSKALAQVNQELWARVSDLVDDAIIRRDT